MCPFCGRTDGQVKAGRHGEHQRYKCTQCQRRYTPDQRPRGHPAELRQQATLLRAEGLSTRQIALRLGVSLRSVHNWLPTAEAKLPVEQADTSAAVPKRRMTITDVAAQAQVSISTISNFLNGKGRMSPQTRTRIQEAMDILHFTPSDLTRALRERRTGILGVFIFGLSHLDQNVGEQLTVPLLAGINYAAGERDYNLLLFTGWGWRSEDDLTRSFLGGHIDGLIWVAPEMHAPGLERVARAGLPTVALLTRHVPEGVGYVNADNLSGIQSAVAHLVQRGHRRIAYFGDVEKSNLQDRLEGYRQGLRAAGLKPDPALELILPTPGWEEYYPARLEAWLALPEPPTAIVAGTDGYAQTAGTALRAHGLLVPEQMALTGFDDIPDAQHLMGGLTTVRQPFREMGQAAVDRLLARMGGAAAEDCQQTLPTTLVVRRSTATVVS